MRKLVIFSLLTVASFAVHTAKGQENPTVMTINGKPIALSEFVYSYKKNNGPDVLEQKTVKEYVDLFVNYKLKVEAALDAHYDTLTSYNKEFRQYRDQQVLPTIINDADVEQEALKIYNTTKDRIGPEGLVLPQHILMMVGQNPSDSLMNASKLRADSLYSEIKKGADFESMAKQYSQDPGSAQRGGEIGWISRGQTLKAFEEAAFALKKGEVSQPVLSEAGYHIIKMKDRKQLESYDELRDDIMKFIEKRDLRRQIAQNRLKAIAEQKNETEQQVMDARADSISAIDQDMKYLIQEYHDGLLLYEVSNHEVWEKAASDEKGLGKFFKKNKKKYAWDEPRFKGIAYHTKDIADVEAVKKSVKGKKFDEWASVLRTTFNNDSVLRIRVEKGIFKKGDNGLVDKMQFGVADAKVKTMKNFPHDAVYGKMLSAPEEMSDVKALVVADYQELMEKEWVKSLREKYPVDVRWDIIDKLTITPNE
ncbi:MAG: peptidylprolyl isomerase [Prevotella sp.]|jgi:peptidyl-prolyl cis-trans isomerase SurA|nr:peptidylprolyl isomerase [Prevotella sp.]